MRQHRYIRLAAALTALSAAVAGTAVIGAAPAGAADECMNVTFPATRLIDWDGYNPKVEYSPTVSIALAAGSYGVTGSSSDGYPSRVSVTQTSEIWELQFLDATGTVIATSGLTGDLPDRVADATWSGSLGTVTLPAAATAVRDHHCPDAIADGSANSVVPVAATVSVNDAPMLRVTLTGCVVIVGATSGVVSPRAGCGYCGEHQLARRQCHGGPRDLRHHPIHDLRREHLLRRAGRQHGRGASF